MIAFVPHRRAGRGEIDIGCEKSFRSLRGVHAVA